MLSQAHQIDLLAELAVHLSCGFSRLPLVSYVASFQAAATEEPGEALPVKISHCAMGQGKMMTPRNFKGHGKKHVFFYGFSMV